MISTPAQEAKIAIEDWQHRLTTKGPLHPAPTIAQAQQAQHGTLIVSCAHCKRTEHVPLDAIRRPPDTSLADLLPALICTRCGRKGPPTAIIRGLAPDPIVITLTPVRNRQP